MGARLPEDAGVRRFVRAMTITLAFPWPAAGQSTLGSARNAAPCVANASSASAATLWEQARAGFRAIVGARPPKLEILRYVGMSTYPHVGETDPAKAKRPAPAGLVLSPETLGNESFSSTVPWSNRQSAQELETHGYVVPRWNGVEVHQPIPEVLLAPSFVRTHCFSLAEPRPDRARQAGIAFRPTDDRAVLGDVAGVLWMTGEPAVPVALEYRYVGPAPVVADRIEGLMTFRTTANGAAVVDGWWLSAARTVIPTFPTYVDTGGAAARAGRDDLIAFRRTTGVMSSRSRPSRLDTLWRSGLVVLSADWPDRTAFRRTVPALSGRVLDAATSAPLAGQAIRLSQLWLTTTGDGGEFTVGPVPAGRFTVTATDTSFERFGLTRSVSTTISVDTSALAPLTLRLPSSYDAAKGACLKTLRGGGKGIVAFRAVDSTGASRDIGGVTVTIMSPTGGRQVVELTRPRGMGGGRRNAAMVLCGIGAGTVVASFSIAYGLRGDDFVQVNGKAALDTLSVLVRGGR
jgi:hypothetical protein